jgi:co-chaperonin GroES (HSP10)
MHYHFTPSPGIVIISPLKKEEASIIGSDKSQGRIIKGKIIAIGGDDTTTMGEIIKASKYGKTGDIVWFLSYYTEGGYDRMEVNGELLYCVKFADIRAVEK